MKAGKVALRASMLKELVQFMRLAEDVLNKAEQEAEKNGDSNDDNDDDDDYLEDLSFPPVYEYDKNGDFVMVGPGIGEHAEDGQTEELMINH